MKKRTQRLIGGVLAAGILAAVFFVFVLPRLGSLDLVFPHTWPGRDAVAEAGAPVVRDALLDGAENLLDADGVWVLDHVLAARGGTPEAERSEEIRTEDQVLLLQYWAEEGRRVRFESVWSFLEDNRMLPDGTVTESDGTRAANGTALGLFRALAEGYSQWNSPGMDDALLRLADGLWGTLSDGLLPADAIAPAPSPTPFPSELVSPAPTGPPAEDRPYARIDGLDVYTLGLLAALDARWNAVADRMTEILERAYLGEQLPLYAAGYILEDDSLLPYGSETAAVDTRSALLTALHLSEAGQLREETRAWLRARLYNDRKLYRSYDIVNGAPMDAEEDPVLYALSMRIARVIEDPDLYTVAADCLMRHIADLRSSLAYGTVFSMTEEERVQVLAEDNLRALLALR